MNKPFQRTDCLRAQQRWMILVSRTMHHQKTITYKELDELAGISHGGVIRALVFIWHDANFVCKEKCSANKVKVTAPFRERDMHQGWTDLKC